MAKAEFLRTIKKNIPFVNLSTTFIFLAIIFLISIVSFFMFNKHIVENMVNKKQKPEKFTMNTDTNQKQKPEKFTMNTDTKQKKQ